MPAERWPTPFDDDANYSAFDTSGYYHGPSAPGPGWKLAGQGPHGGNIWAPPEHQDKAPEQETQKRNGHLFERDRERFMNIQKALGIKDRKVGDEGLKLINSKLDKMPGGKVIEELLRVNDGGGATGYDQNGFAQRGNDHYQKQIDGKFSKKELSAAKDWLEKTFNNSTELANVNQYRWLSGVVGAAEPAKPTAEEHVAKNDNKIDQQIKAIGGTGVQAGQVKQHARNLWKQESEQVAEHNEIVKEAARLLNFYKGKGDRTFNRSHPSLNGGDYNSLRGYDQVVNSLAHQYPGTFKDPYQHTSGPSHEENYDNQEKLWSMLKEGPKPKPSLQSKQVQAMDEFIDSNPKLKADKPAFQPVKGSPLSEERQKQIYDSLPRAAIKGNTTEAHKVLGEFETIKSGGHSPEQVSKFVDAVKSLNLDELWVAKKALRLNTGKGRAGHVNALLEKAGLGHHAIDTQPKDVPFSEEIDDEAQEARNASHNKNLDYWLDGDEPKDFTTSDAVAAWLSIDGDADDLEKLLEVARAKHTDHAEPTGQASQIIAPAGKKIDNNALHWLMNGVLDICPRRLFTYVNSSLREIGVDNAVSSGVLFTQKNREKFQADLASVLAQSDLVGRSRVRTKADQVYKKYASLFDDPSKLLAQPEEFSLLTPMEAYDYFINLVPTLNVHPDRFGELMERKAFTLAVATEKALLQEVQDIIGESIRTGSPGGAVTIRQLLIQMGVAPDNPQYAEAVYRTNVMDSSAVGHDREMASPDMQETFPAFLYSAITTDKRGRPWHVAKNGLLYPSKATFTEVRGTDAEDVINCRCTPIAIDKFDLADRLERGEIIQTRW